MDITVVMINLVLTIFVFEIRLFGIDEFDF